MNLLSFFRPPDRGPAAHADDELPDPHEKPFFDHLEDLRWMLVKIVGVLLVTVTISAFFAPSILQMLYWPLRVIGKNPEELLVMITVTGAFSVHVQIALYTGILFAIPAILYFIGEFVLPALTNRERRMLLPSFAGGAVLFVCGVLFCYFLLMPQALKFFFDYNSYFGARPQWTIESYMDFVLQLLLGFGLSFEMPLIVFILNVLGIISNKTLREHRRHAFLVIFVISCSVVPSTDPLSIGMMAGPLYALYEGCIVLTYLRERRLAAEDKGQAGG